MLFQKTLLVQSSAQWKPCQHELAWCLSFKCVPGLLLGDLWEGALLFCSLL